MVRRYPSLFVLLFVITGIVAADRLGIGSVVYLVAGVVSLGAGWFLLQRQQAALGATALCVALGFFSAFHFAIDYQDEGSNYLKRFADQRQVYQIFGRVSDWPDLKPDRTEMVVAVDSLVAETSAGLASYRVVGSLLLKISDTTTSLQRADRVIFRTRLYPLPKSAPSSDFDYGRFLNLKGVQGIAYLTTSLNVQVDRRSPIGFLPLVDQVRSLLTHSLETNLTPTAAALAKGFLIGETRQIPTNVYRMFRDSGTMHLLAVSGSNVALVVLFCIVLLRPFRFAPPVRSLLLLTVILVFAGLSYGDPSVVRASIMASLVLIARLLGRKQDLNNTIAVTALIVLAYDPAQLFDVGFQLSFVTAWGLIFLVPKLAVVFKKYQPRWWYRFGVFPLMIAIVAQVCSTPIVIYYFERFPVVSVLANLVVVPMVSLAVIAIMILLLVDLIWPLLGFWFGSLVDAWLNLVIQVLIWFGGDDLPVLNCGWLPDGTGGTGLVLAAYLAIGLAVVAIGSKRARRWLVIGSVAALNLTLVFLAWPAQNRGAAEASLHAVPGGVAAFVGPVGATAPDLVVTGLSRKRYLIDERVFLPLMSNLRVDRLHNLYLLSADYDALDDLLRLARDFECRTVYAAASLRGSLEDVRSSGDSTLVSLKVVYFGPNLDIPSGDGFRLAGDRIVWQYGHDRLVLVERMTTELFDPVAAEGRAVLVIGSRWSPAASDWIRLADLGYDKLVCSRFEQIAARWPDDELSPDHQPPDYLHDLSRQGYYRLVFPAGD